MKNPFGNPIGDLFDISKNVRVPSNSFTITEGGWSVGDMKRLFKRYKINTWDYQITEYGIWFRVEEGQYQEARKVLEDNGFSFV